MNSLTRILERIYTLSDTYWVRFPYRNITYGMAVLNTQALIQAAAWAGVRRLVHVSIASAAKDSPYPCYRGKVESEDAVSAFVWPRTGREYWMRRGRRSTRSTTCGTS